jgi:phospholipid/cholesterol/gamma-HCH transport system permease protein
MCLILAGKVGSNIASEIGTMRVTQQIDALEIMGINSASFIILPKIAGLVTMIPMLVIFSIVFGLVGAYTTACAGVISVEDLTVGIQYDFNQWYVFASIIKSIVFAFIISSVSSFHGYFVEGGSFDVGKASTNAVVSSSMLILFADIFLTQLLA